MLRCLEFVLVMCYVDIRDLQVVMIGEIDIFGGPRIILSDVNGQQTIWVRMFY